jgi:hypothetical protein
MIKQRRDDESGRSEDFAQTTTQTTAIPDKLRSYDVRYILLLQ